MFLSKITFSPLGSFNPFGAPRMTRIIYVTCTQNVLRHWTLAAQQLWPICRSGNIMDWHMEVIKLWTIIHLIRTFYRGNNKDTIRSLPQRPKTIVFPLFVSSTLLTQRRSSSGTSAWKTVQHFSFCCHFGAYQFCAKSALEGTVMHHFDHQISSL